MRWVKILAAGYALSEMMAYADPAASPVAPLNRRAHSPGRARPG